MSSKHSWIVGLTLVLLPLALSSAVEAATRGIPGITTAATQIGDTIRAIGLIVAPILIIIAVYEARQHAGFGVLFTLVGVLIVVGVIVYADDIVNTIKPGAALAFTGGVNPANLTLAACWEVGQQLLAITGLAEVIRRVRRP